jgi:insertion element IS1 protein InsB
LLERERESPRVASMVKVEEVEADEMWSFVGKKQNQRWLWHAIDPETGIVLGLFINRYEFGLIV